jgi:hypothetical protein
MEWEIKETLEGNSAGSPREETMQKSWEETQSFRLGLASLAYGDSTKKVKEVRMLLSGSRSNC